jgi:tetratricopeptide (TPR) repeat protein
MVELFHPIGIENLKEKLFHQTEKNRLKTMKKHTLDRDRESHNDFLSKVHDSEAIKDHAHQIEHHGSLFWNHYYQDERPVGVLRNEGIPAHEYGIFEERSAMETYLITVVSDLISQDGLPKLDIHQDEVASLRRWIDFLRLAEAAMHKKDFAQAERNFRLALNEAQRWTPQDLKLSETLFGLGNSLSAQGRHDEAKGLYERAKSIISALASQS